MQLRPSTRITGRWTDGQTSA